MQVPQSAILYLCACGDFSGTWGQIRGHRAHRKTVDCQNPPDVLIDDSVIAEEIKSSPALRLIAPEKDAEEEEPEIEGAEEEPVTVERRGRPPSAQVSSSDKKGRSTTSEYRPGFRPYDTSGPTKIKQPLSFTVLAYSMYDAFRKHLGFSGNFNDFLEQCLLRFWELCGFDIAFIIQPPPMAVGGGEQPPGVQVGVALTDKEGKRQVLAGEG